MTAFDFLVTDPAGMHARPAGLLVKKMQEFSATVTIAKSGKSADAKKLFAVMGLAIKQGDTITLSADGDDEQTALEAAKAILEDMA